MPTYVYIYIQLTWVLWALSCWLRYRDLQQPLMDARTSDKATSALAQYAASLREQTDEGFLKSCASIRSSRFRFFWLAQAYELRADEFRV